MGSRAEKSAKTEAGTGRPVLVLRLKKKTKGRFPLHKSRLTMGRASNSDIVMDDSSGVSRNHAHVLVVEDEVVVEDLGSRNGTFVNGRLTTRRTLKPGDRIAIGHYRLHFLRETPKKSGRTPPETEITRLFRLWGPAAVAADAFECPLCHSLVDAEDGHLPSTSETGDYRSIDDGCAEWFDPPAANGEAPSEGIAGLAEAGAEDAGDSSAAAGHDAVEDLDEDELMARVERLVGLASDDDDETAPVPTPDDTASADAAQTDGARAAGEQGHRDDEASADEPADDWEADGELDSDEADDVESGHGARGKIQAKKSAAPRRAPKARVKPRRRSRLRG